VSFCRHDCAKRLQSGDRLKALRLVLECASATAEAEAEAAAADAEERSEEEDTYED
jgi:hypothetical protein